MKRFFKIFGIIIGSILALLIALVIFIQTPYGQKIIKNYVVDFLEKKLGTPVAIERISFSIPKNIELNGVLFIDKNNDTLLSLDRIDVNVAMLELLNNKFKVNSVDVEGLHALMYRPQADSMYNYQFIIDAFSDTSEVVVQPDNLGEVEEGKAQSMLFDVNKVRLKDISFVMNDEAGGFYFDISLDSLLLKPKEIDPGKMTFLIDELNIHKVTSTLKMAPSLLPEDKDTSTSKTPFILSADQLNLTEATYHMLMEPDSMYLYAGVGNLNATLELFDLEQSLIVINQILLENAQNKIVFGKATGPIPAEKPEEIDVTDTSKWRIFGQKLVLNNIDFSLDDNLTPRQTQGLDYSHMDFRRMSLILDSIDFRTDTIKGHLSHLAGFEKSGLEIQELKSRFFYHDKGAELTDLYLKTPFTLIQDKLLVSYPSLEALSQDPGVMYVDASLKSSQIAINDIFLVSPPSLWEMLMPYKNQLLKVNGEVTGYLSNLKIKNFELDGLNNTRILLDGVLTGLPNPDRLKFQFNTVDIATTKKDILPFLPAAVLDNMDLPESMAIKGTLHGSIMEYYPDVNITTTDGNVALKGQINIGSTPERYNLSLATQSLNVGKIIKQKDMIGHVTLYGDVKGSSFDVHTMDAQLKAQVASMEFNGYNYTKVDLDGRIKNQLIDLVLESQDFNADMNVLAQIDISQEYPSVVSTIQLRRIDVQKLGFFEDALELKGDIDLNFSKLDPDFPVGHLNWAQPFIKYNGEDISLDSLYVHSEPTVDSGQNIVAYIPRLLDARLKGQIPLTKIGDVALSHINEYFVFDPNMPKYTDNYHADLSVHLNNHGIIQKFVPDLDTFSQVDLTLNMNPTDFKFKVLAPYVSYGSHVIDNLVFNINDSNSSLLYNVHLDNYHQKDGGIYVNKPMLYGNLKNNLLTGILKTHDRGEIENYALGFNATYNNGQYRASLLPRLLLNYEQWQVANTNMVFFHVDSGFKVNDLNISKGNESIAIKSTDLMTYNSPFDIHINNFELANLSRILNPDTLLAEGVLNAKVNADISDSFPKLIGGLSVDKLKFYETEVGQLKANVSNEDLNVFDLTASITQLDNNIFVKGGYYMTPIDGHDFNFDVDLQSLNLRQFEGLAFGHLRDSKGFIKGALALKGTTDNPQINGHIVTDNLATRISLINSYWSFPSERIDFDNKTIRFNDFKIFDSLGQHATIKGQATTKDFTDFDLNLNFNSNRWMATNSTTKDFEWMHGRLILSSNIDITGTSSVPVLNGNVVVHDSTNFTYANLDDGPGMMDHEGYVVFVDNVNYIDTLSKDTLSTSKSTAMSMNLNIETEKEATFNVLVNALSGDILTVNGAAFINANMIPGGTFALTGNYQIEDGFYELNYNFIRKKFRIQQGSSIQLTGDPMQADVNISAVYTAEASAYDLMDRVVSEEELVFYKQRLPFDVVLNITGKPLSPNIRYDIVLSEDDARNVDRNVADNIQRQLTSLRNNVSEMSKQVFGMLILGRFIAEDPIKSGNPVSMELYARQTASRFLSQQLNNLADKYVSGLDLSLDLQSQEDYFTGQRENRTDVNLQASKTLLNDRLKITIGNDFQIEGRQLPGQQNNLIPGNVSLDYKLTKDGKYNVRGYRKNELINVVDGYVVETGAGLMMKYDYNRFRELFYSKEKLREIYRKRREAELKKEAENDKKDSSPVVLSKNR